MKVAVVEQIDPEENTSIKIQYKVEETKFGYDFIEYGSDRIVYCVKDLESQYLGDNDYLIEVKE